MLTDEDRSQLKKLKTMARKTYFTPEERLAILLVMHVKDEEARDAIREAVLDIKMSERQAVKTECYSSEAGMNTHGS